MPGAAAATAAVVVVDSDSVVVDVLVVDVLVVDVLVIVVDGVVVVVVVVTGDTALASLVMVISTVPWLVTVKPGGVEVGAAPLTE